MGFEMQDARVGQGAPSGASVQDTIRIRRRGRRKREPVHVSVTGATHAKLRAWCESNGMTMSEVVTRLVDASLAAPDATFRIIRGVTNNRVRERRGRRRVVRL